MHEFPELSVNPRVGISRSASEADGRFDLSVNDESYGITLGIYSQLNEYIKSLSSKGKRYKG